MTASSVKPSKNPKPPLKGRWPSDSEVGGVEAKSLEYAGIMGISQHPTSHPSVSFADSSPQGEP